MFRESLKIIGIHTINVMTMDMKIAFTPALNTKKAITKAATAKAIPTA